MTWEILMENQMLNKKNQEYAGKTFYPPICYSLSLLLRGDYSFISGNNLGGY